MWNLWRDWEKGRNSKNICGKEIGVGGIRIKQNVAEMGMRAEIRGL